MARDLLRRSVPAVTQIPTAPRLRARVSQAGSWRAVWPRGHVAHDMSSATGDEGHVPRDMPFGAHQGSSSSTLVRSTSFLYGPLVRIGLPSRPISSIVSAWVARSTVMRAKLSSLQKFQAR